MIKIEEVTHKKQSQQVDHSLLKKRSQDSEYLATVLGILNPSPRSCCRPEFKKHDQRREIDLLLLIKWSPIEHPTYSPPNNCYTRKVNFCYFQSISNLLILDWLPWTRRLSEWVNGGTWLLTLRNTTPLEILHSFIIIMKLMHATSSDTLLPSIKYNEQFCPNE